MKKILCLCALIFLSGISFAGSPQAKSRLPMPRFMAMRSDQVNVRVGPGFRYPIEWVFENARLYPLEVIAEFDSWLKVRDTEGAEGWVHQSMLANARTILIRGEGQFVYKKPQPESSKVARLQPGVILKVKECNGTWCHVHLKAENIDGWVEEERVWGVFPAEKF